LVQICINECGSTQGPVNMNVYSYQYADSGTNAAQNFSKGLTGWGVQGPPDGDATIQLASDATSPSLLIQATAGQQSFENSSAFAVTPGSAFTLTVQARISPSSTGSAVLAFIFLIGGSEVDSVAPRVTLPFTPGTSSLGTVQTANDGSYSLTFAPQPAGVFQLQASYWIEYILARFCECAAGRRAFDQCERHRQCGGLSCGAAVSGRMVHNIWPESRRGRTMEQPGYDGLRRRQRIGLRFAGGDFVQLRPVDSEWSSGLADQCADAGRCRRAVRVPRGRYGERPGSCAGQRRDRR
jgi:hypothetical protein